MKKPAEVRLIASSIQVIPDHNGMDEWGNFPLERKRLFDLLAKTNANGVILLSGNVHFAELSRYEQGAYPLIELTSSGMTHINELYGEAANDYRVGEPYIAYNFGMVEINWEEKTSPSITLKAIGEDGSIGFTQSLPLDELQPGANDTTKLWTRCTVPRPQVCTMDYRPVCAKREDGSTETYSNGCTACSDQEVVGHVEGACRL